MNAIRLFFRGGLLSYRALFNWLHPAVYIPTMLGGPAFQMAFFVYLGRFSAVEDDRWFVIGNATQAAATACLFGMVMMLANEREFGTLPAVLATPANRLALFGGRAVPVIGNGLLVSAVMFTVAALLGVRVPVAALPAVAATVALSAVSCAMFGLAVGSIGLRVRDLWVGSNLAYSLTLLLCGVNVPLSALPPWLAAVGRAMPLTHGIEAARRLATGSRLSDVAGLIGREASIGLCYALLGYSLLRLFEWEGRRTASLDLL